MKAAMFVFLLAVCGVGIRAQNIAPRSADVTIGMSEGTPEYCLGEILSPPVEGPKRGPDDITLRLPLKVRYENHRSETIIVPPWIHDLTRMTVAGQNGSTALKSVGRGGMDVNTIIAMSSPDTRLFWIIPGGNYGWSTASE